MWIKLPECYLYFSASPSSMEQDKIMLGHGSIFRLSDGMLSISQDHGCFSNLMVMLWAIEKLSHDSLSVSEVNFSNSFRLYRGAIDKDVDFYSLLFRMSNHATYTMHKPTVFNHHGFYHLVDYHYYTGLIKRYFSPSDAVLAQMGYLSKKYSIKPERTVGLWYRGADKKDEVQLASPRRYLEAAKKSLKRTNGSVVWLQTDESKVIDMFLNEFGDRCIVLEELESATGSVGLHHRGEGTPMDTVNLLSVARLMAQCKRVVLHTGNIASWICLFRGGAQGVIQFNKDGWMTSSRAQAVARFLYLRFGRGHNVTHPETWASTQDPDWSPL